jgi:DNA (cytosine-5)-methyltransferase 3A
MKILSLFDGISCGQVALERAGIPVDTYYAFENDDKAIKVTQKNYSNTIQCGDVFDNDFTEFKDIDILIGGSPCTFWSKAKAHTAKVKKELDTNGMGWKLFKRYVLALKTVKPKYFLYENNEGIPEEIIEAITKELGFEPILINSNLVSAQNRKRLYWTNIPNITQPEDKHIYIKDIMVEDPSLIKVDERIGKTAIKTKNYIKYDLSGKGYYSQQDRAYFIDGKFPTVPRCRTETKFNIWLGNNTYKKTCPLEIERLQTLPDNYTEGFPKTTRFELIGNGWTVDVIAHILSHISL